MVAISKVLEDESFDISGLKSIDQIVNDLCEEDTAKREETDLEMSNLSVTEYR